jgi:DNA-binding transcriptional LysR family regulator
MNWDDLKLFLAIAENRTLSAAAREIGISQPTVSRRLKKMESSLGAALFHPGDSGYELTQAGEEILETAIHVQSEILDIDRRIFGHDQKLKGPLRVTCTEVMSNVYLAEHFATFIELNPEVNLSIHCTFQHVSLNRREADVAIRVTTEPEDTLAGKRLCNVAVAVYGSKKNVDSKYLQNDPDTWDWIGFQDDYYNRLVISSQFPKANIRHRVDDMLSMRYMASAGLGVVALPCYVADRDPGLVRLEQGIIHKDRFGLWMLYHPDVRKVARVRAFVDYISEKIIKDKNLFSGDR